MAIRCSLLSTGTPLKSKCLIPKNSALMIRNSHAELQNATISIKKFAPPKKVFEDKVSGVLCYRDENGELICEGYDEGPRFTWQTPPHIHRNARIYRMERRRLEGGLN